MSKPPLRVPIADLAAGELTLAPEAAAYVARVHRLAVGDRLVVFDPDRALEADAAIAEVGKRAVVVRVEAPRPALRPPRAITLIQGIGKGDKMDAIARDATELGVTRIIPALCERSVARPDAARAARWRRIAVEAARQCGRGDAPIIDPPTPFLDVVRASDGARFCLDPRADRGLGAALAVLPPTATVAFAVGPEGGLSDEELAAAAAAGFTSVSIGRLILRTETVCAAVLGALLVQSS
ncbi:Ribosomal RNA small subunit methyltransferase E [Minicystis rosea]|nr:Ribosomal RNA small subunit methyltransferase E [Minicystis rosea]